ncbi:MAG: redoxin family protein [Oscillospiraceae bacterium]|nr:redoxin family protein [Oscillospiraceae bacterium]MBR7009688.1 redoxin family protein [Oscillospiraceae bacterium]
MKKLAFLLCLLLTLSLLLCACKQESKPTETAKPETGAATETAPSAEPAAWDALYGKGRVGTVLPDFSVAAADGGTFTLSEALKDHELVLINLWATWCPPCNMEFPFLEEAYAEYKDRVAVLALTVEEKDSPAVLREFARTKGLSFTLAADPDYALSRTFNVSSIPTSLLLDRDRTVLWMEVGAKSSAQEFKDLFDTYLSGSAAGKNTYVVNVVDQNGAPVPGAVINFCTDDSCVPVIADEAGRVVFTGEPFAYHLRVLSVPEGYDYVGSDEYIVRAEGDELTVSLMKLG